MHVSRRRFLTAAATSASLLAWPRAMRAESHAAAPAAMNLGLVTYQWGNDWDLPTLLANCAAAGIAAVELRTEHKHGVEPTLSAAERQAVRQRFADSGVVLVGYGSNAEFHSSDPAEVHRNVELTKAYVKLMHDCGGSGVKVKPNSLPKDVPHAQTLEQIGKALNEVGAFGADYGQQIRLEVHGSGTSELPNIKAIMDVATHPNVRVCWNSNNSDLIGEGLAFNFNLVKNRLGDTLHVRELDAPGYPYAQLLRLLVQHEYAGWVLLECTRSEPDRIAALKAQKDKFAQLLAEAQTDN